MEEGRPFEAEEEDDEDKTPLTGGPSMPSRPDFGATSTPSGRAERPKSSGGTGGNCAVACGNAGRTSRFGGAGMGFRGGHRCRSRWSE